MRSLLLRAADLGGTAARHLRGSGLGLAGAALICCGVGLVYLPAALIVAGGFLLLLDGRS